MEGVVMGEEFGEREFKWLDYQDPETAEEIEDLLRALRRKKGFGLFFVQCNPAKGEWLIKTIRERFPRKRLVEIKLNRQSETLYWELLERYQGEGLDVACITGVEQALYSYEDTKRLAGWSSQEIYNYSWKGVPPLLSHLNRQRETIKANLPIVLIFFVPSFVIDYFIQRAPDFFDWRSGFFKFVENSDKLKSACEELVGKDYEEYRTLTSDERMEKILEIKDKILQLDSSDWEQKSNLLREQGRLFESDGDSSQALDCYDRALIVDYNNYKAWNSKSSLLYNLERYEEMIESCDRFLKIKPDYVDSWNIRGLALHNLRRYEEAIESYDRALDIQPEDVYGWTLRGIALENLERYEEALASYKHALQIQPDYDCAWVNRGDVLHKLERNEEALASYERALEIKPDFYYAWSNRGRLLYKLERNEEALASYERALEIKPDFYYAWSNRGDALRNLERYEEALTSYERTLELQPDYQHALIKRGGVFCILKQYEEAFNSFDRALELQPNYHIGWTVRGRLLYKLKQYEEALTSFDRALELQPNYHIGWICRGYSLLKMGQQQKAFENLQQALDINGDKAEFLYYKACFSAILGKSDRALDFLEQSIQLDPANKENAKKDSDFDALRDNPKFKAIVESRK
ncbi:MAG: tetratricopeptide repeat protein [Symploca sp. SIO3E6]|nr:tetratricopeptide repeat protein [Caldora sp. SIO3E6]